MVAQRIGENLAFVNWVVLAALAVGTYAVVLAGRFGPVPATKGYLGFTAIVAAVAAGLAWLADGALPLTTTAGSPVTPDPSLAPLRSTALAVLAVASLLHGIVLLRGGRAPLLAAVGGGAGALALGAAALGWGGDPAGVAVRLVQLLVVALATGGALGAMLLGHWYLVTPKLPEAPLVLVARLLLAVVVAQAVLFAVSMALGGGTGGGPLSPLVGEWALFVWLRLLIGLVFPLAVTWAAIQTARTRSMESATGLLYIDIGAIGAGTILAAGLWFGAGLVV
ncbi:MAG: hypothetical protein RL338_212 [Chloroflexota bacterium]